MRPGVARRLGLRDVHPGCGAGRPRLLDHALPGDRRLTPSPRPGAPGGRTVAVRSWPCSPEGDSDTPGHQRDRVPPSVHSVDFKNRCKGAHDHVRSPTDRDELTLRTAGQDRPELQKIIQAFVDSGIVGVQLRVHDERGEWVGSAGTAELGGAAKPPTNGHFRIGSSTKTFVATLVLQLVAEGEVELDTPAADYLPEFGLDERITVRMLLQHTSGVFNFTGEYYDDGTIAPGIVWSGQEWVDNRFKTYRPQELVELAVSKPLRFEPGTDWSYSNTNYVLARLLIEKVTGRSFAEELRRLILGPLGLSGTVAPGTSTEVPEPHAHAYYRYEEDGRAEDGRRHPPEPLLDLRGGDMISTTQDLHTFFSALMGGKLLRPAAGRDARSAPEDRLRPGGVRAGRGPERHRLPPQRRHRRLRGADVQHARRR
ncbi:serine hydrolase domain-containing protein [Streptosporangium lutulentum]